MALTRPGPVRWLWYAVGGTLPEKHREWVLHDMTAKTWVLRHAGRSSILLGPLIGVWLLLPAPLTLRLALVLMATLVGFFYSFAYMEESIEHRLVKHGFPMGTGKRTRAEANEEKEAEIRARYLATYRPQDLPEDTK